MTEPTILSKVTGFSFKSKTTKGYIAKITVTMSDIDGIKVAKIRKRILVPGKQPIGHRILRRFNGKWLAEQVILLKDESLFQVAYYVNKYHK